MPAYIAHHKKGSKPHTLLSHLGGVAHLCSRFAKAIGMPSTGRLIGLLHDLGKYSDEFQTKIQHATGYCLNEEEIDPSKANAKVDHSTAGGVFLRDLLGERAYLAAACILGHHAGLADNQKHAESKRTPIQERLNNRGTPAWQNEESMRLLSKATRILPKVFEELDKHRSRDSLQEMLRYRMLFSCLVDADFLDTEVYMDSKRTALRNGSESIPKLLKKLKGHMTSFTKDNSLVSLTRAVIHQDCAKAGRCERPGFFKLTTPTGGGKTLGSVRFGLEHSEVHGMDRIIYVLPFTSITEQNAEVFRKVFGEHNVLEHHSNLNPVQDTVASQLSSENWDKPIVVTTTVRFFESLYGSRSSDCRRLHNIANSVIVLDEVQQMPAEHLQPMLKALQYLVTDYGCSVVFCTATQPSFQEDIKSRLGLGQLEFKEIHPGYKTSFQTLTRVISVGGTTRGPLKKTLGNLCQELKDIYDSSSSVLCIQNTRKGTLALFEALTNAGVTNVVHLSTTMTPQHRRWRLEQIRKDLAANVPLVVVSTQLIEAGVDVDFAVVYREESAPHNIAQAAGRANREGKREKLGELVVFSIDQPFKVAPSMRLFLAIARQVVSGIPIKDILDLDWVSQFFQKYYRKVAVANDITSLSSDYLFERISKDYKVIDSEQEYTVIVLNALVSAVDANTIRKQYSSTYPFPVSRAIRRIAQQCSVKLFPNEWEKLVTAGALEISRFENVAFLKDPENRYNIHTGILKTSVPTMQEAAQWIV